MSPALQAAVRLLPDYLAQHVLLSLCALLLGLAISLPLAVAAARSPRLRWPALTAASLVQTIPSLALLALFYPLLLGVSALTRQLFGVSFPALGFLPALLALTLYAVLPILRNGVTGLTGVDAAVLTAADAVGMTRAQKLWRVELPLAAPVIMAGVRTAAVWTIGAATLATPVGQTSLGNYIFAGLQTEDWTSVLFGCFVAAALAMTVDQLLGLVQAGLARRDRRRVIGGLAGVAVGAVAALSPLAVGAVAGLTGGLAPSRYVVGSKNFSEQYILASVMADRIAAAGGQVARRDGLGSAVAYRALAAGELDVYVDYAGTLWTNVLGRTDIPPRAQLNAELAAQLKARDGVVVLGALGFENAYALLMRGDTARRLSLSSLTDLALVAPSLRIGGDVEFFQRPEWAALQRAYGLTFAARTSYQPTFMYRALESGQADVISGFSSDGRIAAQGLVSLSDPKGAIPPYDALVLVSPKRAKDARLRRALQPLIGRIDVAAMRQANLQVDRDADKRTPAQAADWLEQRLGLPPAAR